MATGNVLESAVFLPALHGALAAHLHISPRVTRTVIIVPPLVEERKSCHHALVETGRLLAAQGAAVLRFDPRGCGDSIGSFADFSMPAWSENVVAAAHSLRKLHPQLPQLWLGVRAGALMALRLAAVADAASRPDALVLWEPVSGADFFRQLLQRRLVNEMLAYGQAQLSRDTIKERLENGEPVDFDGYQINSQLYRELQELQPVSWNGPALIVSTGPDIRTADTCHTLIPGATRLSLRLPPFWNTVGHVDTRTLTDATVAWVAACHGTAAGDHKTVAANLYGHTSVIEGAPATAPDGETERMVAFSGARGCLRGVLHRPAINAKQGRIVFLHGWSGDRTGPHRMFVHAARRLASLGYTSLRFDFGGRGDSDGPATGNATIASMVADTRAAIAWLRTEAPDGGPIILMAICSGCKVAISTAALEPDVARLALWSAESMGSLRNRATGLRKRLATLRIYARKLLQPETWRKLLRGQVRAGVVGKALVQAEVRSPEEARAEDATLQTFRRFRGDLLLIFGGSDPDTRGSSQAYMRFCRENSIPHTCHIISHAGHSFYGMTWEHDVLQMTEAWLQKTGACESNCPAQVRLPDDAG